MAKNIRDSRFKVERRTSNVEALPEAGFTLIEVVLTIALLALVLTLVLPRVSITPSFSTSTRHLVGAIQSLFTAAAGSNRTYRLNIDLDQHMYWASVLTSDGDRFPSDPSLGFRTVVPSGIRFEDITTGRYGRATTGKVFIEFLPGGRMDRAVIHLSDHANQMVTMVLNPLTGGVQVSDGYREPPKAVVPETYQEFFKALPPRPAASPEEAVRP